MLSTIPSDRTRLTKEDLDRELLRAAIIAELDAINLYEQMAAQTQSIAVKNVLLEVAKEEKTHVGEFQALLLMADKDQEKELEKGKREVAEIIEV